MAIISPWQPALSRRPRGMWPILGALLLAVKRDTPPPSGTAGGVYNTFEEFIAGREADIFGYLWRLSNGVWKDAPLPIASTTDSTTPDNSILAVHMLSETQGWLITASIPPNDVYHLENGRWVKIPGVTMPNPFNANAFAFVSPDEFWAIGEYGISHYRNGAWKNVGSPAMS